MNQVRGLPEKLLEGRFHILQDWMFDYLLKDSSSIGPVDRAIYKAAYESPESIRAGNGWYQTFPQDIADSEKYRKVDLPILALGATGYSWLADALNRQATHVKLVKIENSGHFIAEEQPGTVIRLMIDFFN